MASLRSPPAAAAQALAPGLARRSRARRPSAGRRPKLERMAACLSPLACPAWPVRRGTAALVFMGCARTRRCRRRVWENVDAAVAESASQGVGVGEGSFFSEHREGAYKAWTRHSSPVRYGSNLTSAAVSATTRRVAPIVLLLCVFSVLLNEYNSLATKDPTLPELVLPMNPFDLTAPLVGLLLVFRTESSYARYKAGGELVQQLTSRMRGVACRLLTWSYRSVPCVTEEVDETSNMLALYHQWIFASYLQPNGVRATATSEVFQNAFGLPIGTGRPLTPAIAELAVVEQLYSMTTLNDLQKNRLDEELSQVSDALSKCEYLIRTPIPLGYTRATTRFLFLWLTLLPFALVRSFSSFGEGSWWDGKAQVVVPAAMFFISFMFLSLEDVAAQIEEPFRAQRAQLEMLSAEFVEDVQGMKKSLMLSASEGPGAALPNRMTTRQPRTIRNEENYLSR